MANQTKISKKQKAAQRKEARQLETQSRDNKRHALWALAVVVGLGGIYGIITYLQGNDAVRPGEAIEIMSSSQHIEAGQRYSAYNSSPPTSGPHATAVPWGISPNPLADENLVHNLEHGGIWISYRDLDQPAIDELRKIALNNPRSVVLSPRAANDAPIVLVSWGRRLQLETVVIDQINEFIAENINKSPERLAR